MRSVYHLRELEVVDEIFIFSTRIVTRSILLNDIDKNNFFNLFIFLIIIIIFFKSGLSPILIST